MLTISLPRSRAVNPVMLTQADTGIFTLHEIAAAINEWNAKHNVPVQVRADDDPDVFGALLGHLVHAELRRDPDTIRATFIPIMENVQQRINQINPTQTTMLEQMAGERGFPDLLEPGHYLAMLIEEADASLSQYLSRPLGRFANLGNNAALLDELADGAEYSAKCWRTAADIRRLGVQVPDALLPHTAHLSVLRKA